MTRRFSIDRRRQVAEPSPQPLDETEIATRIARILNKAPKTATAPRPSSKGWLGESEDRDLVDNYLATTEGNFSLSRADPDAEALFTRAPVTGNSSSNVWVTKARRQRFRGQLRDASAWAVSIVVAVVLVGAASVALFGWPDGGPLQQLKVRSINVSAAESSADDLLAKAPAGALRGVIAADTPERRDVR